MSTKRLDMLAAEEANRKTSMHVKADQKGPGQEVGVERETNGDIIRWNKIGPAMLKEGERYARPMKRSDRAFEMQTQSRWSEDQKLPVPKIRKDFAGNGNIISWM